MARNGMTLILTNSMEQSTVLPEKLSLSQLVEGIPLISWNTNFRLKLVSVIV
jgi:hypothetical protein